MTPQLLGTKVYKEYAVKDVVDYIDWNPFFQVGIGVSHTLSFLLCTATPHAESLSNLLIHSRIHSPTRPCLHSLACPFALIHAFTLLLTYSAVLLLHPSDVHTGGFVYMST